jgi:hypothetical protein
LRATQSFQVLNLTYLQREKVLKRLIRDSLELIVWAVPAGGEGAPVEGRGARQDNRLFLDGRAGVCYCFSESAARPARRFMGPDGACDSMRNEKWGKPLKTNNCAKWSISHP